MVSLFLCLLVSRGHHNLSSHVQTARSRDLHGHSVTPWNATLPQLIFNFQLERPMESCGVFFVGGVGGFFLFFETYGM